MAARGPSRTCVSCRVRAQKTDLFRIVAGVAGPAVDPVGTGRGAYVHRRNECIDAMTETRLARALRGVVTQDEVGRLRDDLRTESGAG